ncbi:MAG: UvrD-helicase domain-containing protein [Dehalococcoidia bacterium]|nr:UvrD-helicase domain-containing protein [Dehalococcoidia bacterium]
MVATEHILQDLNPPQREAVTAVEGPLLILAGPGSGKTRVITHRIAYLVDQEGVAPWRIVAVTFTNKAAREMRQRVFAHLGDRALDVALGTFHSICARLLRVEGERIGLQRSFNIYDDADQMAVIKRVTEALNIDPKKFSDRAILSTISRAKSELVDARTYAAEARDYFAEIVARSYERYQALLAENAALDFDDLILKAVTMLQEHESIREKYEERYLHVLVDEFQDTNLAQYELARILAGGHGNICAVGDPDQSIYSWRSADIRNILNFERDFPGARIVLLEQNYRSTQHILDAAHAVISGNRQRTEKSLWTDRGHGEPIVVFEAYDEGEEADFIAGEIARLTGVEAGPGDPGEPAWALRDFAVMYRTNAQSRAVEEALIRAGIRYQLVGGTRFYERREVKDVLAYLRLVHNPYDMVSLARVLNVPGRGIGTKTVQQLERWAQALGVPLYTALQILVAQESPEKQQSRPPQAPRHPAAARQAKAVVEFVEMLDELMDVAAKNNLSTLLDGVVERTAYRRYLYGEFDDGEQRWENVEELRNVAAEYDGLAPGNGLVSFLEDVALISDQDTLQEAPDDAPDAGRVTLITLHSAKGLEYRAVFMIAMEEGVLPHVRSFDEPAQLEEERRLAYVGMTRARERLYLLRAFKRYAMGASQHNPASRFLKDIPPELIAQRSAFADGSPATTAGRYREPARVDARPLVPEDAVFSGGEKVRHPRFGEGIVVSCRVANGDQELTVAFKGEAGIKRLLLSLAPLERL